MTPHGPSVQLGRRPLSVCSSNLEEDLQGSTAGEKWVARPVQACKDRAERERGPAQSRAHAEGEERWEPAAREGVCLDTVCIGGQSKSQWGACPPHGSCHSLAL